MVPPRVIVDENGYRTVVIYRGTLTEAIITDPEEKVSARGYAKLSESDEFDADFGEYLARLRSVVRLNQKLIKIAAREGAG